MLTSCSLTTVTTLGIALSDVLRLLCLDRFLLLVQIPDPHDVTTERTIVTLFANPCFAVGRLVPLSVYAELASLDLRKHAGERQIFKKLNDLLKF